MHAKNLIFAGLTLLIALLLTACQGTNSDTTATSGGSTGSGDGTIPVVEQNSSKLTLVLPVSSTVLTTNSQVVNIEVRMFDASNNPYSDGIVTKVNPNDVLVGRDIGSFDKDTSTLVNGVATFVYTAPANLELNTSNINFSFYHESNTTDARVYTMSIVPEVNQTILTDYELRASNASDLTIPLESSKSVSYSLFADTNTLVPDASISSMTVTLLNPNLVTLQDSYGNSGSSLSIANKNAFSVNILSGTRSGLVPIKVDATYTDSNNAEQNISKVFDLVVLSGPPTAISLQYKDTEQNEDGLFVENWVLTATDKYANLINSNPTVSMGAIIGYAQSSAATSNVANYLYFPATSGSGTLSDADPDTFTAAASAFDNVDLVNDKLVLLGGTGYKFNAYGKWDIANILSSNQLQLVDDFEGTDVNDLGFAVGNNFRNEVCDDTSTALANVYPKDLNSILDNDGSMILQVKYSTYLTGKDIVLWTNIVGSNNNEDTRVGLAKKLTLRGQGLEGPVFEFTSSYTGTQRLNVSIANTPEFYKNANFSYILKVTGTGVAANVVETSMDGGITSCNNNGVGYVDVQITSGGANGGTIELTNLVPTSEF